MRKFGVLLALAVSAVGGWLSCSDPQPADNAADMAVVDLRPVIHDLAPTAVITVQDDYYSPQEVTIPVGGKVRWVFQAASQHGVFPWDMGFPGSNTMSTGTFENTFNQVGTFDYGCAIHGRAMPGRVIVK
jgi:plastocyanin